MISVEILRKEYEQEYATFLLNNNSVAQQSIEWRDILNEISTEDSPFYFVAKESGKIIGTLPTFILKHKLGNVMNSLPYAGAYGGVTIDEKYPDKEKVYKALTDKAAETARKNGCVLFTIVSHPFMDDKETYEKAFAPDFTYENFMHYIEMDKNPEFNKKIRWNIAKAEKSGIKVIHDQTTKNVREFYRIFETLMNKYQSKRFSEGLFINILNRMVPKDKAHFIFAEKEGKIIAGVLLLYNTSGKGVVDYFHTAFDAEYNDLQPNSLLIDAGIRWAQQKGLKIWNWQSTKVKDSSVFKFKERWGSVEGKHFYYTKVIGDISRIKELGFEEARKSCPWYYVLPKFAWENKKVGRHE